ncbi:MAG: glycine--tRNA ligase subunit beta, partial [Syntrophomonadaceae bacterium]|nr:glycine--tRNA ligase subunit beta [Syntrophomonadaceae bacterium]
KYLETKPRVEQALASQKFAEAMLLLAGLRPEVDLFFDAVMVMVEEEELKAARLGILKSIAKLCQKVADFSKIVG